ncbi:MAG: hypothetical protein VX228_14895, partial [Pseudomonadota bacterium]|nr:hypothetical protein [Pseudomonadota bacterium]
MFAPIGWLCGWDSPKFGRQATCLPLFIITAGDGAVRLFSRDSLAADGCLWQRITNLLWKAWELVVCT